MRHGSNIDPPNRFTTVHHEQDLDQLEWDKEHLQAGPERRIEYLSDSSKTIVSENNSPDIPFRYSLNPYRGCIHGCSYCYARPTHEYLGFSAGLDFETRIIVKHEAPELFRQFLSADSWKPEPVTFSGVTDCYQPAEREFRLTRQCLEVALACRQPVSIVTKNALVVRDLDILQQLAADQLVHVFVSITTLSPELARDMEPRTSIPSARLQAIRLLAEANVPVGAMVSPVIPGLNDSEIPAILEAVKVAGAQTASYILLRLPLTVETVFKEWLNRTQASKSARILSRIRDTRDGRLNDSTFGDRMKGTGNVAEQIDQIFQVFRRKHGLDRKLPPQNCQSFQPPIPKSGQLRLF